MTQFYLDRHNLDQLPALYDNHTLALYHLLSSQEQTKQLENIIKHDSNVIMQYIIANHPHIIDSEIDNLVESAVKNNATKTLETLLQTDIYDASRINIIIKLIYDAIDNDNSIITNTLMEYAEEHLTLLSSKETPYIAAFLVYAIERDKANIVHDLLLSDAMSTTINAWQEQRNIDKTVFRTQFAEGMTGNIVDQNAIKTAKMIADNSTLSTLLQTENNISYQLYLTIANDDVEKFGNSLMDNLLNLRSLNDLMPQIISCNAINIMQYMVNTLHFTIQNQKKFEEYAELAVKENAPLVFELLLTTNNRHTISENLRQNLLDAINSSKSEFALGLLIANTYNSNGSAGVDSLMATILQNNLKWAEMFFTNNGYVADGKNNNILLTNLMHIFIAEDADDMIISLLQHLPYKLQEREETDLHKEALNFVLPDSMQYDASDLFDMVVNLGGGDFNINSPSEALNQHTQRLALANETPNMLWRGVDKDSATHNSFDDEMNYADVPEINSWRPTANYPTKLEMVRLLNDLLKFFEPDATNSANDSGCYDSEDDKDTTNISSKTTNPSSSLYTELELGGIVCADPSNI